MTAPRVVIAPAAFKGTLSATAAAQAMAAGVRRAWPQAEIVVRPMADGGDDTLSILASALAATMHTETVRDASGAAITASFALASHRGERLAIIEAAQAVGLNKCHGDVWRRSTQGVGDLLRHALDHGAQRIWLALGGTGTNDGGAGMLAALGVTFADARGELIAPTPADLARLAHIDVSALDSRVRKAALEILSDVTNPLTGDTGATFVFGPQKGVAADDRARLDAVLARFAELGDGYAGQPLSRAPGSGAAGGLGYALLLLGAKMRRGAEAVAEAIGLDAAIAGADWVLTGEGSADAQTLAGKAPAYVAARARALGTRTALIAGRIDDACAPLCALFPTRTALAAEPGEDASSALCRATAALLRRAGIAGSIHRMGRTQ